MWNRSRDDNLVIYLLKADQISQPEWMLHMHVFKVQVSCPCAFGSGKPSGDVGLQQV